MFKEYDLCEYCGEMKHIIIPLRSGMIRNGILEKVLDESGQA